MNAPSHRRVGGRYQIVRQLGRGGFGQTFVAQDLHLPEHPFCVVKQLQPQVSGPEELQTARRLFDTEAKTLYRLGSHPDIPTLLAHFEDDQEFYLVQELIDGVSLEAELAQSGPWPQGAVMRLLQDLLTPLAFVHEHQVIHRDLKPSNLIRRRRDQRLVLIDFGAVKQVNASLSAAQPSLSHTIAIGTEGYMPSEQVAGRPKFSSDVYAVGVIAIQALSGQPPVAIAPHPQTGELDWHHWVPHGHPALLALLDRMVQYDFRTRYATAADALAALAAAGLSPASAAGALPGPSPPAASPSTARPTVAVGRQPPPTDTAQTPHAPPVRRSRAPQPWLPIGAIVLCLGLGLLLGRTLFSGAGTTTTNTPPAAAPAPTAPEVPSADDSAATPEAAAVEADPPEPAEPQPAPLTPTMAREQVSTFYGQVSNQSWEAARSQLGGALAQQFDASFFEQFQRVTVENLQVTRQTPDTIELVGQNTYVYPDGSTQREERTYTVRMEDQPRIVDSAFVSVIQPRN